MTEPTAPPPQEDPQETSRLPDLLDSRTEFTRRLDGALKGSEAAELALRFAALSAHFDPNDALLAAGLGAAHHAPSEPEALKRMAVVSELADACETRVAQSRWRMRSAPRARILEVHRTDRGKLVQWRRTKEPFDDEARGVCKALIGEGEFSRGAVLDVVNEPAPDAAQIRRLIDAITLAQPVAPAGSLIPELLASLAKAQSTGDPEADLLEGGVYGRDKEFAEIRRELEKQWSLPSGPLMVYVGGMGGVGKSTLLAEVRRRERADGAICVSLDFDRPGIEGGRPLNLAREVARQVTEQLGSRAAVLYGVIAEASGVSRRGRSDKAETGSLMNGIADVVRSSDQRLLLSLDTIESLTLHGDVAARDLLDWLRELRRTMGRVAVIAAGRETLPRVLANEAHLILLDGLPPEASRKLLATKGFEGKAAEDLISLARGNPLVLRLGMRLLAVSGTDGALQSGGISGEDAAVVKAGQLYRLILSRIPSEELRAIAHPGLLLRQLNARMLREVIAPAVGLGALDPVRAQDLLDRLARHAWLVDLRDGWLVHRPELRLILLELQIEERPERAKRIFSKAAAWHRRNGPAELQLYYRLQGCRWSPRMPEIRPDVAYRFSAAMIEELPETARNALALARGERSGSLREDEVSLRQTGFRGGPPAKEARDQTGFRRLPDGNAQGAGFDPSVSAELRSLLDRRQYAEAAAMVGRIRDFAGLNLAQRESNAIIEALWRLGAWARAGRFLRDRLSLVDDAHQFGWEEGSIVAAFADTLPTEFRRRLRFDETFAKIAQRQATSFEDNPDWDVAGLLLAADGRPTGSNLVETVWRIWTGPALAPDEIQKICERLSTTLDYGGLSEPIKGLQGLIRSLTPDSCRSQILQARLQSASGKVQQLVPGLATATLNAIARDPGATADMPEAASFVVDRMDSSGALPHLATALALLHPALHLKPFANLTRRRAATIGGFWSFGAAPKGWRQGDTDLATNRLLSRYGPAPHDAVAQARRDVDLWAVGYGSGAADQFDRLLRRGEAIAEATPMPLLGAGSATLSELAQRMIAKGMPLALVPTLSILTQANSPIEPRPLPSPRAAPV
jgi:hypothetical protein